MNTEAFLYKWTELSTGMWYIGSRSAKGCHINDGYICSSSVVKPLIQSNPSNWIREILVIGPPRYIVNLETLYLKKLGAKGDRFSYNKSNGGVPDNTGRVHTVESIKIMSNKKRERNDKPMLGKHHTQDTKDKLSAASKNNKNMLGKHHSEETKQLLSNKNTGKPRSKESIEKMMATNVAKGGPHNKGVPCSEETKAKIRATKALQKQQKELTL
jgi:group I intron endonuclease